jgi:hypothetical protein
MHPYAKHIGTLIELTLIMSISLRWSVAEVTAHIGCLEVYTFKVIHLRQQGHRPQGVGLILMHRKVLGVKASKGAPTLVKHLKRIEEGVEGFDERSDPQRTLLSVERDHVVICRAIGERVELALHPARHTR